MSADDPLAAAISDWQHKHRIADGDPMIAALELVRIYLRHAREADDKPRHTASELRGFPRHDRAARPPLEIIRPASSDIIGELRRFGQSVERLNRSHFLTQLMLIALGIVVGVLVGRLL